MTKTYTLIWESYPDYLEERSDLSVSDIVDHYIYPEFQQQYAEEVSNLIRKLNSMKHGDHFFDIAVVICKEK